MSELWNEIDLNRHGVIEAHAGTGKTYTITRLVLRILEQCICEDNGRSRFIDLRGLLLVTYTEKAAGELKKRIREGLEERIASLPAGNDVREHLENCLNTMHEALIGTIHAVCLRLLRVWPFETGIHFDSSIADDVQGVASALRESMRTDWQREETCIPWALSTMNAQGRTLSRSHFDLIRRTAVQLLDGEYSVLDRSAAGGLDLRALRELSKNGAPGYCGCGAYREYTALLQEYFDLLRNIISDPGGFFNDDILEELKSRVATWGAEFGQTGFLTADLTKIKTFGGSRLINTAATRKHPLFRRLAQLHELLPNHLFPKIIRGETVLLTLIGDAAERAARLWKRKKGEQGLLSYGDMLLRMLAAVRDGGAFAIALRRRIRYAVIDEFQDTSRVQWEIFRRLFLDGCGADGTRLYLVGDPKQSIYGFQGADVRSYLDAKETLCGDGAPPWKLRNNYRSLPQTVAACNAVFASGGRGEKSMPEDDWFLFGSSVNGIGYGGDDVVSAAQRSSAPARQLPVEAMQVMAVTGTPQRRMRQMAQDACHAIRGLVGTTVSLPHGAGWRDVTLAYEHFAVIAETHRLAEVFLGQFRKAGIPAVKYKLEGVFQSPMARALHALLRAVASDSGEPATRLSVLLTPFFNRRPDMIDPATDGEPCGNDACSGEALCVAHALAEWKDLAQRGYWAHLFDRITARTDVEQRLMRLRDGERRVTDLRQVIDYCIERLYTDCHSLGRLVEHLGNLVNETESAGRDANLHLLETQKSSVKVLTIHASKGLEYPVVFVATDSSKGIRRPPGIVRWMADDAVSGGHSFITPYLNLADTEMSVFSATPAEYTLKLERQERRRLLYVALTRAQALVFVPMHLKSIAHAADGTIDPAACVLPDKSGEDDLTPRLLKVLAERRHEAAVAVFDRGRFDAMRRAGGESAGSAETAVNIEPVPDIRSLALFSRICRQTSYTQLSRATHILRESDKSEEPDETVAETERVRRSGLPGGSRTGDALHCALEELLRVVAPEAVVNDQTALAVVVEKYLRRNRIDALVRGGAVGGDGGFRRAVDAAVNCIGGALTAAVQLPGETGPVVISRLDKANRIPETEFMFRAGNHWVHGFMDLVFRVKNSAAGEHPWRYHLLDWKSDTLESYSEETIAACITERHYDLQSRLYLHALDLFLNGVLGKRYRPEEHLGSAVYCFLREHEEGPVHTATVWCRRADPADDRRYVAALLDMERQTAWS